MKQKHYIGVDPGKTGGITVLSQSGKFISKHPIPLIGKDIDLNGFVNIFDNIIKSCEVTGTIPHVCIEKVHAIFGSSASSTFSFGYCVGLIDGVIKAYKLPYTKIQPKEWQSIVWQTDEIEREPDKVAFTKKGIERRVKGKIKTKVVSLKAVKRLFPEVDLRPTERSKIFSDGLVDSLLIAEACRRLNH